MLSINAGDCSFTVKKRADRFDERKMFGLANLADKYVFMIGGYKNRISLKSVSRYDIANNRWEYMPELSQGRYLASACSLKDKIYVFGGRDCAKAYKN